MADIRGVSIVNLRTGRTLCNFASVALSAEARRTGLLKSLPLQVGEGLLLAPCAHIHTVGMQFNIDVVFLDAYNIVLSVGVYIGPGRQFMCPDAVSAVELRSGAVESSGTCPGDQLELAYY